MTMMADPREQGEGDKSKSKPPGEQQEQPVSQPRYPADNQGGHKPEPPNKPKDQPQQPAGR